MSVISHIHAKIGDLWWYTILLFVVQRFSDMVNMFVGLWLVPRYVPIDELGTVLPITAFVGVLALPLSIVSTPFLRFLSIFHDNGEDGKVKALLYDGFLWAGILSLGTMLLAYMVLPFLFERLRIASGSLGMLMVIVAILGAVSVIFGDAVRGLKLYGTTVWLQFLAAPFRLLLMVILMPFRPLSGYVIGQGAVPGVGILGAIWRLRGYLRRNKIAREPYWSEHGREILRYTWPFLIWTLVGTITGSIDTLVIRQRLSEFESAGYYMITRFSDIAAYLASSFAMFIFPMVARRNGTDGGNKKILAHAIIGSLVGGGIVVMLLAIFGHQILGFQDSWIIYQPLSGLMVITAIIAVAGGMANCMYIYEMAQGRFRFMWYAIPIMIVKSIGLYILAGYSYFSGILPVHVIGIIEDLDPNRLSFVLWVMLVAQTMILLGLCLDVFRPLKNRVAH